MLTGVALAALALTVAFGLVLLVALVRSGRTLPRIVLVHLATGVTVLVGWTAYAVREDRPTWLVWSVFVLLIANNTLGDTMMVRGWRARARRAGRSVPTGARAYLAAVRELLTTRPTAAVHAVLAGVGFFSVLLVALGVAD